VSSVRTVQGEVHAAYGLGHRERSYLLGGWVNRTAAGLLLRSSVRRWAQPQRGVGRLHGLPHHADQFLVQRL
jgi:hypothetical protein